MNKRMFPDLLFVLILSLGLLTSSPHQGWAAAQIISAPDDVSVSAITAGYYHTCAVMTGGGAKCWGSNFDGELGNGTNTGSNLPVDVSGLGSGVSAIAAGRAHSCAVAAGGGAKCWGDNFDGELGDGTKIDSNIPVNVSGLGSGISAIATGGYHTCALTTGGGMKCWGYNYDGELGDGTNTASTIPVNVSGLGSGVSAITAGEYHTCALTTGGAVKCWGLNTNGQLGNGSFSPSNTPQDVSGLGSGIIAISAGYAHTCALTTGGGVKCWGRNTSGQLGNGTFSENNNTPVDVSGLGSGVSAIDVGGDFTCARTAGGGAKCWGYNSEGELGNGLNDPSNVPVDVSGLSSGVSAVASGGYHACALMSSGGANCWGQNADGELGNGTYDDSNVPVSVLIMKVFLPLTRR